MMFKPEEEVVIDLGTNPFLGTLQTTNFFGTLQTYISEAADDEKQKCVLIINQKDPEEISFASPCLAKTATNNYYFKSNSNRDYPVTSVIQSASMTGMVSPFKRKDLRNLLKSKDQQGIVNSNDCWIQTNEEEEDFVLEEDPNIAVKLKELSTKNKQFKTPYQKQSQQQRDFNDSLELVEVAEWIIPEDETIQSPLSHIQKNHCLVIRDGHITKKELALKSRLDENNHSSFLLLKDKQQQNSSEQIDIFGERANLTSKSTLETSYNNLHSNQNFDQEQKRNHKRTNSSKEVLEETLRCSKYKYIINTRSMSIQSAMKKQLNSTVRWQQRSDQCFYSTLKNSIINPQPFKSSQISKNQNTTNISSVVPISPQKLNIKNHLQKQQQQSQPQQVQQNKIQQNFRALSSNNSNTKLTYNHNTKNMKFQDHKYILESPQQ